MNDSRISSGNPFLRASQELKATGKIIRPAAQEATSSSKSPRARLNFIPDEDSLLGMIDRALQALSRGLHWDRGSILNLLV
jgi:hypothetical protein